MSNETVSYKDAFEREKKARLRAEELLENKTREIFIINEQLKTQADALVRSNEELTHFAFVASHDLKEPLRKIKTFSGFLLQEYSKALPDEAKDYIVRMNKAVERMDALIEGLLHYSRTTRNVDPFQKIDLNIALQEVISDLESRIKDTKGEIEILNTLPSIEADLMQIRQLLQNLIGNALKFHQINKVPKISISSTVINGDINKKLNQMCEITISDNGIGFDEKYVDKIFGIFQRLHSQSDYEGSGIGLSICKRIVERHHGTIKVKSAPDIGATFIITIPISQGGIGS